jgi:rhodanese-related sulfurtransferase
MASAAASQTTFFSSSRRRHGVALSPRAAFQSALHGRARLVDLRPAAARERDGELPAYLLSPRPALGDDAAVIALDENGDLSHGTPHVAGGFRAWRAAGMPTVSG